MERLKDVFKNGINYTNYGKANFALKILQFREIHEDLMKKIMNNPGLAKELGIKKDVNKIDRNNSFVHVRMPDDVESLEKIYDVLIGNRLKGSKGEKRKEEAIESMGEIVYHIEMEQVEMNREIINYDIVLVLAYYLVIMDDSRTYLWERYGNSKEELINYYKKSIYRNKALLDFVPGMYIEQAICIVGLILKCRELDDKDVYNDIIYSIRRCNKKMTNYIKKLHVVKGESIQQIGKDIILNEDNVLIQTSGIIVALIVAEALGKEILIDYDMGKYIMLAMNYLDNLYAETCEDKTSIDVSEKNRIFLNKFENEFSAYNSIDSVIYGIEHDQSVTELSEQIYLNYGLSPRKFSETLLCEEEVCELVGLSDSWDNEKYFLAMQIAVLCKYIGDLECYIEERIVNNFDVEIYDLNEKEAEIIKREKDLEIKKREWENRIEKLEKRNIELEAELSRQKKVLEDKNREHENEKIELVQLRNYIYKNAEMEEESDNKIIDYEKMHEFWLEQSVVMIGGHENWQQKIRAVFPKWKYITAGQASFSPEIISDKQYIICNTDVLAHAVYYKVIANRNANQILFYTHGRNIENFLIELDRQIDYFKQH